MLKDPPYDLNPKTTLQKERFRTWVAENFKGKRVSFRFKLRKFDIGWQVFKIKEGRYRVEFSIFPLGHKPLGHKPRLSFGGRLAVHGASLEMVDRLENLEGKEVAVELDIADIVYHDFDHLPHLIFAPRNVCIDGFEIPESLRKNVSLPGFAR